jgi:hypothetical protein
MTREASNIPPDVLHLAHQEMRRGADPRELGDIGYFVPGQSELRFDDAARAMVERPEVEVEEPADEAINDAPRGRQNQSTINGIPATDGDWKLDQETKDRGKQGVSVGRTILGSITPPGRK